MKPRVKGDHAAITPDELPEFLKVLEENESRMYTPMRILMRLMMLVFMCASELIETRWPEIDLENEQWVIPWQRMKMGGILARWIITSICPGKVGNCYESFMPLMCPHS